MKKNLEISTKKKLNLRSHQTLVFLGLGSNRSRLGKSRSQPTYSHIFCLCFTLELMLDHILTHFFLSLTLLLLEHETEETKSLWGISSVLKSIVPIPLGDVYLFNTWRKDSVAAGEKWGLLLCCSYRCKEKIANIVVIDLLNQSLICKTQEVAAQHDYKCMQICGQACRLS